MFVVTAMNPCHCIDFPCSGVFYPLVHCQSFQQRVCSVCVDACVCAECVSKEAEKLLSLRSSMGGDRMEFQ